MLNYVEITNEARAKIEELKNKIHFSDWYKLNDSRKREAEAAGTKEEKIAIHNKYEELGKEDTKTRDLIEIYRSNGKIAYIASVLPKIIDILEKYVNKRIGDKTKEKINNELTEALGERAYIYSNYGYLSVNFKNEFERGSLGAWSEICTYKNMYNTEGKFNSAAVECLKEILQQQEQEVTEKYISDPENYISEKKKEIEEINRLMWELQSKVKTYNNNLPYGFRIAEINNIMSENKFSRA